MNKAKMQIIVTGIVYEILKERIDITFKPGDGSCVLQKLKINRRTRIIEDVETLGFNFDLDNEPTYFHLIPEIWQRYNKRLFTILHEIGHVKTIIGINYDQSESLILQLDKYYSISNNHYIAQKRYREIPKEKRADEWAYKWILDHPASARQYSTMLDSAKY